MRPLRKNLETSCRKEPLELPLLQCLRILICLYTRFVHSALVASRSESFFGRVDVSRCFRTFGCCDIWHMVPCCYIPVKLPDGPHMSDSIFGRDCQVHMLLVEMWQGRACPRNLNLCRKPNLPFDAPGRACLCPKPAYIPVQTREPNSDSVSGSCKHPRKQYIYIYIYTHNYIHI